MVKQIGISRTDSLYTLLKWGLEKVVYSDFITLNGLFQDNLWLKGSSFFLRIASPSKCSFWSYLQGNKCTLHTVGCTLYASHCILHTVCVHCPIKTEHLIMHTVCGPKSWYSCPSLKKWCFWISFILWLEI